MTTSIAAAEPAIAGWTTCPSWCVDLPHHRPDDHPDDRVHQSWIESIDLSFRAEEIRDDTCGPMDARASVQQQCEAAEPHLVLDLGNAEEQCFQMTLPEAKEFALGMLRLIRAAQGGQRGLTVVR